MLSLLRWLLAATLCLAWCHATAATLYEQRALYRQAVDHLRAGRTTAAHNLAARLIDYPLHPYLTYHRLRFRLNRLTAEEVSAFRNEYPDIPGAQRVYRQWLARLGASRRWQKFLDHYEPADVAELQCYYLRALYGTGERERALDGVAPLWTVHESQPKACDPLFEIWQQARLTEDIAWQRLRLAIQANERSLARYLQRFFSGSYKSWAQSYYNVHVNPSSITRTNRFATDTPLAREVITHGLRRLARRDAEAASVAWAAYQDSHDFSVAEQQIISEHIWVARARAGGLAMQARDDVLPDTAFGMAQAYLRQRNWSLLQGWIEQLPDEQRHTDMWQYWLARAISTTHDRSERARRTLQALAEDRTYYGFLAANDLGSAVQMNGVHRVTHPARLAQLKRLPAVARTIELFAVGDEINGRREWFRIVPKMTPEEQQLAAYLIQDIGEISLAIRTANDAQLRDHLALRFPLAYQIPFRQTSHVTNVPVSFLIAFARQESAFDPVARSTANARGILQMLHSTARSAARRAGESSPTLSDLYDPEINIRLGGHHIAWLLKRYDQMLPLTAAAYNAGESRANRWIRDAAGWPMDVWIETIPFRETRDYVKNVLAFNQVYSHLLGDPMPMLRAHETHVPER